MRRVVIIILAAAAVALAGFGVGVAVAGERADRPARVAEVPASCLEALVAADELATRIEAEYETARAEVSAVQDALEYTSYRASAVECGRELGLHGGQ